MCLVHADTEYLPLCSFICTYPWYLPDLYNVHAASCVMCNITSRITSDSTRCYTVQDRVGMTTSKNTLNEKYLILYTYQIIHVIIAGTVLPFYNRRLFFKK